MTQETSDGVPISDGFDFPVGNRGDTADVYQTHKVDTVLADQAYFNELGYWHPGEDWNGKGGGDTDLGQPVYAISHGKVVDFGHYSVWGNIVLLEHALPNNTRVWSQYAHLNKIMVTQKGQKVKRDQQIGTIGKGDGNRYLAHLHFEIRKKNLPINNWSPMVKDKNAVLANYYNPTEFINANRRISQVTTQPAAATQTTATAQPKQIIITPQMTTAQPGAGVFQKANVSNWFSATGGYQGNLLWTYASAQKEANWAEWRPFLPEAGLWYVWTYIPQQNLTTTYARYKVVHVNGQTEIAVNQAGNRNKWVDLGAYQFAPGQGYVRLSDVTGEMVQGTPPTVGFDAICWTKAA